MENYLGSDRMKLTTVPNYGPTVATANDKQGFKV